MNDNLNPNVVDRTELDQAIRPNRLEEYIGQEKVKEQMQIFLSAALARSEALDHVLLYGPPGLGKTTLSIIIATEMKVQLHTTSGPAIEKPGDLAAMLTRLEPNDVLFIDEIHRMTPAMEEILYPAMEDYHLDIIIGDGPAAQSVKIDVAPFTLVGATTRAGLLTSPLRDRFGIVHRLEYYTLDELTQIVQRSANLLDCPISIEGAEEIARRSRGTPRIANRLLRRVRDFAQIKGDGLIDEPIASSSLEVLEVDHSGLDKNDTLFLLTILDKFNGGPVGLETLASSMSEEKTTLEDVIEPYLLQQGFIMRTPRGRIATTTAYQYFKRSPTKTEQRQYTLPI